MRLTRLRLDQVRQFRRPVEFAALEPGLNLFAGPNEAGKSTVVAALRAAFLERHRSTSVDDLRPWGDAAARPTVEVDFEVAGTPYRLVKSFLQRQRCELHAGERRLEGIEAEDHLGELLGFEFAKKGASRPEHWGVPGLLWVRQGAGHETREAVRHAAGGLRSALDASVGAVAASDGDEVIDELRRQLGALLTPEKRQPTGAYKKAIDDAQGLAAEVQALDERVRAWRGQVDRLAALRRDAAADEAARPWQALREQEGEARRRLDALAEAERTLGDTRRQQAEVDARLVLLRGRLETFEQQADALARRDAALSVAQTARDAAATTLARLQAEQATAEAAWQRSRDALARSRRANERLGLHRERDDLARQAEAVAAALASARTYHERQLDLRRRLAETKIAAGDLATLRKADVRLREIEIRQQAMATRLRFDLQPGVRLDLAEQAALQGQGERLLAALAEIDLPGLGRLEIVPGGGDLAALAREQATLIDDQAAQLARLGVASLDEAEARQRAHEEADVALRQAGEALKLVAPAGLDALHVDAQRLAGRLAEVRQALDGLLPRQEEQSPDVVPPLTAAEAAQTDARIALDRATAWLAAAQQAHAVAEVAHAAALREQAAAQAVLQADDRSQQLREAERDLTDARAEQATLAQRIEAQARELAAACPDALRQDVERFARSAQVAEVQQQARRDEILRIETELQAAGAQGTEELLALRRREHEDALRRRAELERRAAALDHLLARLTVRRDALTRRLHAPLQRHLDRYLAWLFPQGRLDVEEGLALGRLTRPTVTGRPEAGTVEDLSFGAREQLGIVGRLAYADLLKEAGRPTLLILDDALVHSDAERLGQMKRVLFDAAARHQILLFTCHPQHWRDLGVAARPVETLPAT